MTPTIRREDGESKGRYLATFEDLPGEIAEMTYSKVGVSQIIIDHTDAPNSMRGRGAGRALVEAAVKDARAIGVKIIPLCPFAKAMFEKSPEWSDVLRR